MTANGYGLTLSGTVAAPAAVMSVRKGGAALASWEKAGKRGRTSLTGCAALL